MRVGIVGGGTMGLTLAYRLCQAGCHVTIFEAASQLGGLATWFDYEQFTWDKFYHVICSNDHDFLELLEELHLSEKVRWTATRTGFLWKSRFVSMSNYKEFITFPVLSLVDKIRLAAGILYCQRIKDPSPLEKITAAKWLTNIFGKRVFQAIWDPLVKSKFGVFSDLIPATIMWATINRYAQTRTQKGGQECLGFISGGLKTFYDSISKAIHRHQGVIYCAAPVTQIDDTDPDQVQVSTPNDQYRFDYLINTAPTAILEKMGPNLKGIYAELVNRPKFLGVICCSVVLKRPLTPYYITNLIQEGFPFTGIIEVSNLTGQEELNGYHLVMLPRYDVPASAWFQYSDKEVADRFIQALGTIWPDINEQIVAYYVNRAPVVQALWIDGPPPVYEEPPCNWNRRVWNINAELAGRDTLNNNAIIRTANWAGSIVLKEIGQSNPLTNGEKQPDRQFECIQSR